MAEVKMITHIATDFGDVWSVAAYARLMEAERSGTLAQVKQRIYELASKWTFRSWSRANG